MKLFPVVVLLAGASAPVCAQTSLIARYRLDETAGTTLVDEGPNGMAGTYVGGVTLGLSGVVGVCADFSEVGVGRADITAAPLLASITSDTSYAAWFNTRSVVGYRRVFASQDAGIGVGLFYNNLLFTTRGVQDYVQTANILPNTWYHAVWTFDSTFLARFYLNGQFIGSVQGNGPAQPATGVFHVASRSATTELWDGAVDDLQIYQGTLSDSDVALLFANAGLAFNTGATAYCVAKTNSLGCTPQIQWSGAPNAFVPGGFLVQAINVRNNKAGLLLYSASGAAALPFQGGTLCLAAPVRRSTPLGSGGAPLPTNDCSGVYSIDVNSFAQGLLGGSPLPTLNVAGQQINAQLWGRDPGFPAPFNTTLSDAVEWIVGP